MTHHQPTTDQLVFAGITTATVLVWYALPDLVRSRAVRAVVKALLLGVTAAGTAMIPDVFPAARSRTSMPVVGAPTPAIAGTAAGVAALGGLATVWAEKAIFARGERRRARGVRYAHTPAAVAMALASGAAALAASGSDDAGMRPAAPESGRA